MTTLVTALFALFTMVQTGDVSNSCLDHKALLNLDQQWEQALLERNADFLDRLLADDFIWVHNHASQTDSKESLIGDLKSMTSSGMRSRVSSDVQARVLGQTGVVTGFTVVERTSSVTRYNFMRTYVEVDGRCRLLANHTMAIPKEAD